MFYPVSLLYNQAEEGVKNNHIKLPVCSVLCTAVKRVRKC